MACDPENPCGMCKKNGNLPILLTRYAIAPDTANAPKIGGKFKKSSISLGTGVDYTLRMLRPGYVYLYNPADEIEPWRGYVVTHLRHLYPFRISKKDGPTLAPQLNENENEKFKPCNPARFAASARAIVVPVTAETNNIWIGFSDVEWSKAVWERFDNNVEECRDKLMRKIDIGQWVKSNSPEAAHAALLEKMAEKVVEYTEAVQIKEFGFSHTPLLKWEDNFRSSQSSNTPPKTAAPSSKNKNGSGLAEATAQFEKDKADFDSKLGVTVSKETLALIAAAAMEPQAGSWEHFRTEFNRISSCSRETQGKGMVLAIDDPAGIVMDMAELMDMRLNSFIAKQQKEEKDERALWNSSTLMGLKQLVEAKADEDTRKSEIRMMAMAAAGGGGYGVPLGMASISEYNTAQAALTREKYWKEYAYRADDSERYSESQRKAAQDKFNNELADFNKNEIAELAKAHYKWMQEPLLLDALNYPFDKEDPNYGLVYSNVFSLCIGNTANNGAQLELYIKWLTTANLDDDNLLFRALGLNHRPSLEALKKAITEGASGIFTGKTFMAMLRQMGRIVSDAGKAGETDKVFGKLLSQLYSPLLCCFQRMTKESVEKGITPRWAVLLGWCRGGDWVIPVVKSDTPGATLKALQDGIAKTLGMKTLPKDLQDTVERSYRNKMKYMGSKGVLIIDKKVLYAEMERLAKKEGATIKDVSRASVANAVRLEFDSDSAKELRALRNNQKVMEGFNKGFPTTVNTLNGLFSAYSLWGSFEALCQAAENEQAMLEPLTRLGTGFVAVWSSIGGVAETYKNSQVFLKYGVGVNATNFLVKYAAARRLGFVGPGVALVWDVVHFRKAQVDGEPGLMVAYGVSIVIDIGLLSVVTISVLSAKATAAAAAGRVASAAATRAAAIAAGVSFTGIGLILFIASLAVGAWISHLKDEKKKKQLQEWIELSYFGTAPQGKYRTLEAEQQALAKILGISLQKVKGE